MGRKNIACFHCGKEIKGKRISTCPPLFLESLGDFPKSFHPSCYVRAEQGAARELGCEPETKEEILARAS
jgi:hypothetical protein